MSCDTPSSSISSMAVKREIDEDSCSSTTRHSSIRSACDQSLPIPTHYSPPKRIIQVPKNAEENRKLKHGHIENNNDHIAYLDFPLFWPSLFFTVLSLSCFAGAVYASLQTDFIPTDRQLQKGFVARYGSTLFRCNSTIPLPKDGLPSIIHLFELNVIGNVLFRYANVIPLVLRIFHAHALRGIVQQEYQGEFTDAFKICNDLMPILTAIESLSMALFSIVTVHNDFAEFNRYCKIVFAMTASLNMLITSLVLFSFRRYVTQSIDNISVGVKIMSTALFCYFAPQYFQFHLSSISYPTCHSYLPSSLAMIEYVTTLSYMSFHFTQLIDVRHCHFVCYPRDSSGECEPLNPENFKKGGKYEYCRAFEYNQRKKWAYY